MARGCMRDYWRLYTTLQRLSQIILRTALRLLWTLLHITKLNSLEEWCVNLRQLIPSVGTVSAI
jgi:hypothetical protein